MEDVLVSKMITTEDIGVDSIDGSMVYDSFKGEALYDGNYAGNKESSSNSSFIILWITIGVCIVLGIALGIILGRRGAMK